MHLTISSFNKASDHLRATAFGGIVSIGDPGSDCPVGINPEDPRVLRLTFEDAIDLDNPAGPSRAHVQEILAFSKLFWPLGLPVLVHCRAGVSRSTAASLLMIAQHLGPGREDEAVAALLACEGGATALPNGRMVRLGDAALGRDGSLVRAVARQWS